MAKRLTDTDKWIRPWFRSLSPKAKITWLFLCDHCDHAGIWILDFEVLSFHVGFKVRGNDLVNWLGDKLIQVEPDKLFIPSFFEFQYGKSNSGFKARLSAIETISGYGLMDSEGKFIEDLSNCYLTVTGLLPNSPSISIGISKGISNKGGVGEKSNFDFLAVYKNYPRKIGKTIGLNKCKATIKSQADYDSLVAAVAAYAAHCSTQGLEDRYILHFSTFMGRWRDWLDPDAGTAATSTKLSVLEEWAASEETGT